MRVLVVGAGALGGYFGGRLLAAGRDVTFLVRPRRAEELARDGLRIESRFGDLHLGTPPTVLAQDLRQPFDLVLLSCKAYDLEAAMDAFAPAVGAGAAILPLLNGMAHLDALEARFSADAVLGGVALIGATLHDGTVVHLNDVHGLVFGDRAGGIPARIAAVAAGVDGAGLAARRGGVRRAGERRDPRRDVGEVGHARLARRRHLPDAGPGRRDRRGAWRARADARPARGGDRGR